MIDRIKNLKSNANYRKTGRNKAMANAGHIQKAKSGAKNLARLDLSGANLKGVDLHYADLNDTNLEGTNLEGANLKNAKLDDANLRGANLKGAWLDSANLERADLRDANLEQVHIGFVPSLYSRLEQAIANGNTIWPDYFKPPENGVAIQ